MDFTNMRRTALLLRDDNERSIDLIIAKLYYIYNSRQGLRHDLIGNPCPLVEKANPKAAIIVFNLALRLKVREDNGAALIIILRIKYGPI